MTTPRALVAAFLLIIGVTLFLLVIRYVWWPILSLLMRGGTQSSRARGIGSLSANPDLEAGPATVKGIALQEVSSLPEDASLEDLEEFLFERAMVEKGRAEFGAAETLAHDQVVREVAACLPP